MERRAEETRKWDPMRLWLGSSADEPAASREQPKEDPSRAGTPGQEEKTAA